MTPEELKKYVGFQIKHKRVQSGLRQEDVGKVLRLTRTSIMNIERGRHSGTIHTILLFCQLFKCTPNDLFPPVKPFKYEIEEKTVMVKRKKKVIKILK